MRGLINKLEKLKKNKNINYLFLFLPIIFFLPTIFGSWFIVYDDHEILRLSIGKLTFVQALINDFRWMARFRPFYWVIRIAESFLFRDRVILWHSFQLFILIVNLFLLNRFLFRKGFSKIWNIFVCWFTFFSVPAVASWLPLGPQENLGMLLLLLVLNSIHHKILFLFLSILLFLTKESFLLLGPALIIYYLIEYKFLFKISFFKSLKNNLLFVIFYFLTFFLLFSCIYFLAVNKPSTNGGTVLENYKDVYLIFNNFFSYILRVAEKTSLVKLFSILLVLVLSKTINLLIFMQKKVFLYWYNFFQIFLLSGLFFVPQILLYAGRNYTSLHYGMPYLFFITLLIFYSIEKLIKANSFNFQVFIYILLFFIFFNFNLKKSMYYALSYKKSSLVLQKIINFFNQSNSCVNNIILVGDSAFSVETIFSLKEFFNYYTNNELSFWFLPYSKTTNMSEFRKMDAKNYIEKDKIIANTLYLANIKNKKNEKYYVLVLDGNGLKMLNEDGLLNRLHPLNDILFSNISKHFFIFNIFNLPEPYIFPNFHFYELGTEPDC